MGSRAKNEIQQIDADLKSDSEYLKTATEADIEARKVLRGILSKFIEDAEKLKENMKAARKAADDASKKATIGFLSQAAQANAVANALQSEAATSLKVNTASSNQATETSVDQPGTSNHVSTPKVAAVTLATTNSSPESTSDIPYDSIQ